MLQRDRSNGDRTCTVAMCASFVDSTQDSRHQQELEHFSNVSADIVTDAHAVLVNVTCGQTCKSDWQSWLCRQKQVCRLQPDLAHLRDFWPDSSPLQLMKFNVLYESTRTISRTSLTTHRSALGARAGTYTNRVRCAMAVLYTTDARLFSKRTDTYIKACQSDAAPLARLNTNRPAATCSSHDVGLTPWLTVSGLFAEPMPPPFTVEMMPYE